MTDAMQTSAARRRTRRLAVAVGVALIAVIAAAVVKQQEIRRFWFISHLFEEANHVREFRSLDTIFPVRAIRRGGPVFTFARTPGSLPQTFAHDGRSYDVAAFLEEMDTTGLLVIKDDGVVFEQYYRGNTESTRWISWSMGKSLVSALVGIAIEQGHIDDVMDPVTKYARELKGSGYDGVALKHVLQMSSGVRWNEDYADRNSDINRLGRAFALGSPLNAFAATLVRELEPGTFNRYVSADTHVLGMLVTAATGRTLSSYLEENIWQRIGMEADAYWLLDDSGMEMAMGGLNATLRDYAKFGRLYLNGGAWEDEQVVPAEWVRASITPDAPHLEPGDNPASNTPFGYGYQWWIPTNPDGEFLAIGVFNQFIYVYPKERLVIAKTSAFRRYAQEKGNEAVTIALFRAIASHLHVQR